MRRWALTSTSVTTDRKSTRLNSSHTVISTLSLHDALPIWPGGSAEELGNFVVTGLQRAATTRERDVTSGFHIGAFEMRDGGPMPVFVYARNVDLDAEMGAYVHFGDYRSEEHTSELQSHSDLHSFPTRRSSDLARW